MDFSNAVTYHTDGFPPSSLKYDVLLNTLLEARDALARYDQMLKGLYNSEILLAPLRNQEAVISSRMEGTISTMDEILLYDAEYESDSDKPEVRSDVIETILYRRALNMAQHSLAEGKAINNHLIKSIHQLLLSVGRGATKSPGSFKVEQNYLADKPRRSILYVPISPERLESGMRQLISYLDSDYHPVLLRTAIMHLEFEALHPFQDGNGRIGRMLITLFLWNSGLISQPHFYISGFFEEHKDEYIDTMREVSRTGIWEPWCVFFLRAVKEQSHRNIKVAESIRLLYEEMKVKFTELLGSKFSVHALDYMFTTPVFKNSAFTKRAGIPPATAGRFTRRLVEKQLLKTVISSAGRNSAVYSFEPLMTLVRL